MCRALSVFAVIGAVLAGCNVSLPDETLIQDLRVLELRAEPPEIGLIAPGHSATTAQDLVRLLATDPDLTEVELRALAAHPDLDATFTFDWSRCGPFEGLPCDEGRVRERLPVGTSSIVRITPVEILRDEIVSSSSAAEELAAFASDPRDLLNGVFAEVLTQVTVMSNVPVDRPQIDGLKRFVIFDKLLVRVAILEARRLAQGGQPPPMVEGLDLPDLCTKVSEEQLGKIFAFLDTRVPNRSPEFTELELVQTSVMTGKTSTRALGRREIVKMLPGERIALQGHARPEDKEAYQLIDDNCELQSLNETLSWSWFTNRGSLSAGLTVEGIAEKNREGERVGYTAPQSVDLQEGLNRVRIWSVLRDGRGGSRARVIDVDVMK